MNDLELLSINGGAAISGSVLNAVSRLINTLLDLGRAVGSAINMRINGKTC